MKEIVKHDPKIGDRFKWVLDGDDESFVWQVIEEKNENGYYKSVCIYSSARHWRSGEETGWGFEDNDLWEHLGNFKTA